jgi:hypothetical protein
MSSMARKNGKSRKSKKKDKTNTLLNKLNIQSLRRSRLLTANTLRGRSESSNPTEKAL